MNPNNFLRPLACCDLLLLYTTGKPRTGQTDKPEILRPSAVRAGAGAFEPRSKGLFCSRPAI